VEGVVVDRGGGEMGRCVGAVERGRACCVKGV